MQGLNLGLNLIELTRNSCEHVLETAELFITLQSLRYGFVKALEPPGSLFFEPEFQLFAYYGRRI